MGALLNAFQAAREKLSGEIRKQEEHNETVRAKLTELRDFLLDDGEWLSAKQVRLAINETDLVVRENDDRVATITYYPFIDSFVISGADIRVDDGTGNIIHEIEGNRELVVIALGGLLGIREYVKNSPDAAAALWADIIAQR